MTTKVSIAAQIIWAVLGAVLGGPLSFAEAAHWGFPHPFFAGCAAGWSLLTLALGVVGEYWHGCCLSLEAGFSPDVLSRVRRPV